MNKNNDFWALLKGTMENGENPLDTAIREFQEESGITLNAEELKERLWLVGTIKQRKDKFVTAYAVEVNDIDPEKCHSNMVDGEDFPEVDNYAWMDVDLVRNCTLKSNLWFYEEILRKLGIDEDYQGC